MSSLPEPVPIRTIEEAAPSYDQWFTMIPESVRSLNDGYAVAVYEAIARHADWETGESHPSIALICEHTGWSKPHVLKTIQRLITAGIITRSERVGPKGGNQSNSYQISANVRVSTPLTGGSTTFTPLVNQVDRGGKPGLHELEPVEQQPVERKNAPPMGPPRKRRPEIPLPDGFAPTDDMIVAAMEKHHLTRAEIESKTDRFRNWALQHDKRFVDWNATWRNFMAPKPWEKPTNGAANGKEDWRDRLRRELVGGNGDVIDVPYQIGETR